MSILCSIIGHKPPQYRGLPHYAKPPHHDIWTDGIGRGHVHLYGDCERCGENFHIISFHPPIEWHPPKASGDAELREAYRRGIYDAKVWLRDRQTRVGSIAGVLADQMDVELLSRPEAGGKE